jgi:CheY-like chemotaxis protein/HPt (histidine-containing phosphotransfer) domain-containing protein
MPKRIDAGGGAPAGDADPVAEESTREVLPKTVLVAEDNVVSQQVARHYLQAMGCNVVVVADGRAAVAACARQEFGLVLMDLQMPHMNGLEATQEIRKQERAGYHVPILALTAKSASNELVRCTAAGMNGLLTKPLDIPRLRQVLDRFGVARRALESIIEPGAQINDPVDLMTLHAKFSGDTGFVRRLCQTFVTTTSQGLDEIDGAIVAGERSRIRLLAHKIRSGGSSVYAHRLAAIAANIESEAMTAPLSELSAAVDALRKAFDEATLHIGAGLT